MIRFFLNKPTISHWLSNRKWNRSNFFSFFRRRFTCCAREVWGHIVRGAARNERLVIIVFGLWNGCRSQWSTSDAAELVYGRSFYGATWANCLRGWNIVTSSKCRLPALLRRQCFELQSAPDSSYSSYRNRDAINETANQPHMCYAVGWTGCCFRAMVQLLSYLHRYTSLILPT